MKKFFVKGLSALLPLVLTVAVLILVGRTLYNYVGYYIGEALKWVVENAAGWGPGEDSVHAWFFDWGAPFLGFAVAILLTLVLGFLVATFLGGKFLRLFEAILKRIPVIRVIYPYARQFTDFFFSEGKRLEFKHAVAVPFPTRGLYSIGFVTGDGLKTLNEATGKQLLTVFVPAAPTPISGFVIYVPKEDIIPLPISTEEAMRLLISAGVLGPDHEAVAPGPPPPRT